MQRGSEYFGDFAGLHGASSDSATYG
jgi:hypothetical protein